MQRNTDRDWEAIAQEHPFYGVLTNPRYDGKTLNREVRDEFYSTGRSDMAFVMDMFGRHFNVHPPFASAIDFGCGVGRLSLAMAEHARRVTGVDISDTMLATARQHAAAPNIEYRKGIPTEPVAWVNSHIVLQHIPPARGTAILRQLLALVAPGGVVSIQMPFYKEQNFLHPVTERMRTFTFDGEHVVPVRQDPDPEGVMHMFDYPWPAVFSALVEHGFEQYFLSHTNHGGAHGAWIFSRRTA